VLGTGVALLLPKNSAGPLPSRCVKPPDGYLIVASKLGYNDSVDHGVPANSWPVITVNEGQQVNIVVCNTDIEAHGFQITHYLDSSINSIAPGQVFHVSFVADRTGDYEIYCSIFCSVHAFMQSGLLRVLA
jgi:nitrous oxide reductase